MALVGIPRSPTGQTDEANDGGHGQQRAEPEQLAPVDRRQPHAGAAGRGVNGRPAARSWVRAASIAS